MCVTGFYGRKWSCRVLIQRDTAVTELWPPPRGAAPSAPQVTVVAQCWHLHAWMEAGADLLALPFLCLLCTSTMPLNVGIMVSSQKGIPVEGTEPCLGTAKCGSVGWVAPPCH